MKPWKISLCRRPTGDMRGRISWLAWAANPFTMLLTPVIYSHHPLMGNMSRLGAERTRFGRKGSFGLWTSMKAFPRKRWHIRGAFEKSFCDFAAWDSTFYHHLYELVGTEVQPGLLWGEGPSLLCLDMGILLHVLCCAGRRLLQGEGKFLELTIPGWDLHCCLYSTPRL